MFLDASAEKVHCGREVGPGTLRAFAGALDEGYRRSLMLTYVASRMADARQSGGLLGYLRLKLLPRAAEAPEGSEGPVPSPAELGQTSPL